MKRGRTNLLSHAIGWAIFSIVGFGVGKFLSVHLGNAGILSAALFVALLAGAFWGHLELGDTPPQRCRHQRKALLHRVGNTLSLRKLIFSAEEIGFFLFLGFAFGVVHQIGIEQTGSLIPSALNFWLLVSVFAVGWVLGIRSDEYICTSCGEHLPSSTYFNFKPLANDRHPLIPERCRIYARDVAAMLSDWIDEPASTGGIFVLNGEIGSGKSTFKNLVLSNLNASRNDIITVEIAAWETLGDREIQRRVLSEIVAGVDNHYALGSYRYSWPGMLESLAKGEPRLSPILWAASNISTEEYLVEWRHAFRSLNHKVVVVIEDLERFSSKELFAVLRLVDELREFPNLTFFIPTDLAGCYSMLEATRDQDLPIDWNGILARTLGGRVVEVFTPNRDEFLDILLKRFEKMAVAWASSRR